MPDTTEPMFHLPESLSPRKVWMKRYNVKTFEVSGPARYRLGEWVAEREEVRCYDKTERGAVVKLSRKLWTLEGIDPWVMGGGA